MTDEQLEEMGPIDYVVLEWPGAQPSGEVAPLLVDLVDRGIIRILDIAFMVKGEDGSVATTTTKSGNEFEGVGRNAPCPCGSGKKFKMCHGRAGVS